MGRPKKIKVKEAIGAPTAGLIPLKNGAAILPGMFGEEVRASCYDTSSTGRTSYRQNRAATISPSQRFKNIADGFDPFHSYGDFLGIYDMVLLVNKAYWNFSSFRNIVDTKTDLCNQTPRLRGGNQKARDFIQAWLDKIDIMDIQQQFYTECFRSANVFLYNLNGVFSKQDFKKIGKIGKDVNIPVRYILLNPQYVRIPRGINYSFPVYYRYYSDYEIARLRNPQTQEEKNFVKALSAADKAQLADKNQTDIVLKINPEQLNSIFYKKQDYEPFAVPSVQTALDDINWKLELKKIDRAVARSIDWTILLLTMGASEADGGTNPLAMEALKGLMENESVKRTLIADHTTKGEWLVPPVDKILGQEKYKQVNEDIKEALNAVFMDSEDKFANAQIKVKVFMKGIQNTQQQFLNDFLNKEIRKVCNSLDFKSVPEAYYIPFDLNDDIQYKQIFMKMAQMGILTPTETFEAFQTGVLPDAETSLLNQKDFSDQKKDGLYQPSLNVPQQDEGGRPAGTTGIPQKTKNVAPQGTSKASLDYQFNVKTLYKTIDKFMILKNEIKSAFKKKMKLKESDFTDVQNAIVADMAGAISVNAPMEQWSSLISEYMEKPVQAPEKVQMEIDKLAAHFDIDREYATMLYLSRKNIEQDAQENKT